MAGGAPDPRFDFAAEAVGLLLSAERHAPQAGQRAGRRADLEQATA
ncbi:hypothetical protein ACFQL4_26345 [Halosimplex aquaticum]